MDEMNVLSDKKNKLAEFASIRGNLTEKEIDRNLCININGNEKNITITDKVKFFKVDDHLNKISHIPNISNSMINNLSSDNFLSSTAMEDECSSDDEFDLQNIKREALKNFSPDIKKEDSLYLDYDCSDLNDNVLIHEEIYSENLNEIDNNQCGTIFLCDEKCKNISDEYIEDYKYSILSDHNYMGQEINTISPELSIKNTNDLKNYNSILKRFINEYEKRPDLKLVEIEVIEEMSTNLTNFKNSLKENSNNHFKFDKNIADNDPNFQNIINSDSVLLNYDDKDKENQHNVLTDIASDETEMESIILSENCSEPLEYNDKLINSDQPFEDILINNVLETSEKNDETKFLLNKISTFAGNLLDNCNKFNTLPNQNIKDFINEQFLKCKQILNLSSNNISVQTDYSGNLYSKKGLKKINEHVKHGLLEDSSSSEDEISESSSDSESYSNSENENVNICNGIHLSKYVEEFKSLDNNSDSKSSDDLTSLEKNETVIEIETTKNKESVQNEISNVNGNNVEENKNESDNISDKKDSKYEEEEEKEIDRLLNFKHLENKQISALEYSYDSEKSTNVKPKTQKLLEILDNTKIDELSDGTDSEVEDNLGTEKEYLVKRNEDSKRDLLDSATNSSDSSNDDISFEKDNDESNSSLVSEFLQRYEGEDDKNDTDKNSLTKQSDDTVSFENSNDNKKQNIEQNNNNTEEKENLTKNNIDNSDSDKSKLDIFDKSFAKKSTKEKSFQTLLTEDEKRRKYSKPNDELINVLSSDESEIDESKNDSEPQNRLLRPMMRQDQLTSETKVAQKEEDGRILRLKNKESILKKAYKEHNIDTKNKKELILDYDSKTKKFIKVDSELVKHLKDHQIEGVKFMYDACYGSVNFINEHPGSGCILAHCMGLGKTLQLISLLHTVICNKELKTSKILVLCPKSTVMNWADEIQRWLGPLQSKNIKIFTFCDTSDVKNKLSILKEWSNSGKTGFRNAGCLLIGYEAFRTLVAYPTYRKRSIYLTQADMDVIQKTVKETLLQPGADLVVCDEGHIIKNRKAAISQAVTEISTRRRIVLTGTPIQNNLKEYYSMVNFIKPSFLGTEKEFANLYGNPIRQGQHKDSNKSDIKLMKQRSFVLHKKLSSFVQRREAALLKTFLPPKFEYVLFVPLSDVQTKLYEIFLDSVSKRDDSKGRNLLTDYTCLRKIWTHPKVLENAWKNATMLKQKKESKRISNVIVQSDDDEPDDIYDSQIGLMSVTSDWWRSHLSNTDLESILPSNKLQAMFEILKMCKENGEKCLIFSAFVAVLNVVEYFMGRINDNYNISQTTNAIGLEKYSGPWINGKDYYRLDGQTPKTLRHELIKSFNNPINDRARVFLISAKAGGQGINLIGANRVIILDTSWNPSNDQQNIFRIFRLGQKRNCYIYRLISLGTMEEKVYSRSVTKQAMSFRVVDEHQIDRHYSMAELAELYRLTKADYVDRSVPILPQDSILANLLLNHSRLVYKYHEHDSLLENKIEQELSEQDKKDAWLLYERESNPVVAGLQPQFTNLDYLRSMGQSYLSSMDLYGTNNQTDNPFGIRGISGAQQPSFVSNYGFPGNDPYLDMLAMYQNAQNYSSSLYGVDVANHNPFNQLQNTNRSGTTTNMLGGNSNALTSFGNSLLPFANLNSINPSHYGSSLYSSAALNHFNRPSYIENLQKTLENFPSTGNINSSGSSRIQRTQSQINQNINPFSAPYISNDLQKSTRNTSPAEAIPTSVIMKNDILLKKCNEQIKSAAATSNKNNLANTILGMQIFNQSSRLDKGDNASLQKLPENDLSITMQKQNIANKKPQNQNINSTTREKSSKFTVSSPNTNLASNKPGLTLLKERNKEINVEKTKSSSGILLLDNQPTVSVNKTQTTIGQQKINEQNVSGLGDTSLKLNNGSTTNKGSNIPSNLNSISINNISNLKSKEKQINKTVISSPKNSDKPTINNSQLAMNTLKNSSSLKPTEDGEINSKSNSLSYQNQLKPVSGTSKILTFNDNINQNLVVTNLQRDKDLMKRKSSSLISQSRAKMNSDLIETGKTTYRNTTISNVSKGNEKAIENKFVNSSISITPGKKTSGITIINNPKQLQPFEAQKQTNQRKRPASVSVRTLQQGSNVLSEIEKIKRQNILSSAELQKEDVTNSIRKVQLSKDLTIVPPVLKKTPTATQIFELD